MDHVRAGERGESLSERVLGAPSKVVLAVATIAYVVTAPRHVVGGDDAELATLLVTGGAAHAPGYPLYVLYLRLFRALPAASPAHAAALATSVLGVLSVLMIQRACRAWGAREGATAVGSAVYALSPLGWGLATRAEPFALEAVLAAAIVWLAAPESPVRGARLALGLGLAFGLGMSNEPTIAALLPLALSGALRGVSDVARERSRARAALTALGALAAFAAGLAPYAYTYAWVCRDPAALPFAWGGVHDAPGFVAFLLGGRAPDADPSAIEHVTALLSRVTSELQGLPLLSIAAVIIGAGRARDAQSRTARIIEAMPVALLLTAFALSGPVFAAHLDLAVHGPGGALTERFYLLPMVILTVFGARALDALFGALLARDAIAFGTTVSLLAACAVLTLPQVRASNRPVVDLYAKNTLRTLPPGAVVLASTDLRTGALAYAQRVLHVRPDVTVIATRRLAQPWYRARVAEALGATLPQAPDDGADARAIVSALDRRGAPAAFFTDGLLAEATGAVDGRAAYAVGTLVRVGREGEPPPDLDAWQRANEALAGSFEPEPRPPVDAHGEPEGDAWAEDLAADYARPWLALAGARERAGDSRGARADRDRAAAAPP